MRTAYGSVLVSPTVIVSSSSARPAVRLNVIAPAHEAGQTSTACPDTRCGATTLAWCSVLYAGPTSTTSSAPVESGLDVVTGVGDLREALDLTSGVDSAGGRDLCHVVGKMRSVEESHGVPVEREVEGGRETTVARADDSDVHVDTVSRTFSSTSESRPRRQAQKRRGAARTRAAACAAVASSV